MLALSTDTAGMEVTHTRSLPGSLAALQSCRALAFTRQPLRRRTRQPASAGLFDFLSGGGGAPSKRAVELVDELIEKAEGTGGGSRASPDKREEISELVGLV